MILLKNNTVYSFNTTVENIEELKKIEKEMNKIFHSLKIKKLQKEIVYNNFKNNFKLVSPYQNNSVQYFENQNLIVNFYYDELTESLKLLNGEYKGEEEKEAEVEKKTFEKYEYTIKKIKENEEVIYKLIYNFKFFNNYHMILKTKENNFELFEKTIKSISTIDMNDNKNNENIFKYNNQNYSIQIPKNVSKINTNIFLENYLFIDINDHYSICIDSHQFNKNYDESNFKNEIIQSIESEENNMIEKIHSNNKINNGKHEIYYTRINSDEEDVVFDFTHVYLTFYFFKNILFSIKSIVSNNDPFHFNLFLNDKFIHNSFIHNLN
jgi:hypothetical protein